MLKVRMIEGFSAFVDPWDVRAVIPAMNQGKLILGQSVMFFGALPKMIVVGLPEELDAAVDAARGRRGMPRWLKWVLRIPSGPPGWEEPSVPIGKIEIPGGRHDGN